MSAGIVTVKCVVAGPVEVNIDSTDVQYAIQTAIERRIGYIVSNEVETQIRKLVDELMEPHRETIRARIELQLKGELEAIVVGRRRT